MGSTVGHGIDFIGVGVLRGQRHIPSKNWPKYPPGGGGFLRQTSNLIQPNLKSIRHEKYFLLIWKAFQNTEECNFAFLRASITRYTHAKHEPTLNFTLFNCKQYDVITDLICIIGKTSISLKRKKIFQKEKLHSSVFWKAFQIGRNYFHVICTLTRPRKKKKKKTYHRGLLLPLAKQTYYKVTSIYVLEIIAINGKLSTNRAKP